MDISIFHTKLKNAKPKLKTKYTVANFKQLEKPT